MKGKNTFSLIENYQNYVKSLEDPSDCDMLGLDQEVPEAAYCDVKPEIEQPMIYNMPDFLSLKPSSPSSNNNTYTNTTSLSCSSIPTLIQKDEFRRSPTDSLHLSLSHSTTMSSSLPSSTFWSTSSSSQPSSSQACPSPSHQQMPVPYSSSPSFLTSYASSPASSLSTDYASTSSVSSSQYQSSSSSLSSLSPHSNNMYSDCKSRTYVTELGGSGCTVLEGDSNSYMPTYTQLSDGRQEPCVTDSTEFTSLAESSLCDEQFLDLWLYLFENDREKLNLPKDPHTWSSVDVCRWVKWVCQKEDVPDISTYLSSVNGATLCAWDPEAFKAQYGKSGSSVQKDLDLWKSSVQLNTIIPATGQDTLSGVPTSFQETSQFFPTPSSSPALSNGSSQDSHSVYNSSPEHTEDEVFYPEQDKKIKIENLKKFTCDRAPFKTTTGRGHKKAMTLWQFLLGLLVGPDNHSDCIKWQDREKRIFKIEDSKKVAAMWGKVKSRPAMNYDKLSRSVRQYYKKGIIKKPEVTKRLVYQFCPGIC